MFGLSRGNSPALREVVGAHLSPRDRAVAATRVQLGETEFNAALSEGAKLSADDAAAFALGKSDQMGSGKSRWRAGFTPKPC